MKKFYKLSASISLSLLAVGVMAQSSSSSLLSHLKTTPKRGGVVIHPKYVGNHTHPTKKLESGTQSIQMAYWVDDAQLITGGTTAYSITGLSSPSETFFTDQINGRFVIGDTNSPSVPRQNFNLIRDAIVAFDTIVDQSVNIYTAAKG